MFNPRDVILHDKTVLYPNIKEVVDSQNKTLQTLKQSATAQQLDIDFNNPPPIVLPEIIPHSNPITHLNFNGSPIPNGGINHSAKFNSIINNNFDSPNYVIVETTTLSAKLPDVVVDNNARITVDNIQN